MIDIWGWRKAKGLSDKHEGMESYKQGFEKILAEGMFHAEASNSGKLTGSHFCRADELLEKPVVVIHDAESIHLM
ncbi:hypothetical protein [Maridesulfovibrio salexigens]|uniref:Uncharacterized protein n=1 Tax=Maridesulfovibrio salexigens (strain ATCC 14822 / DSM 2638 / NCIMB 8403 / VKM B-1763) TaxID=526222 RepID=C6BT11_MARSD|nr:hypothetical protein [Maridesulfovibrio salexigens]ACS79715.1 hypothetical protein Desal_1653 [Maridesulfovibrio salexigens DSM 2638]